MTPRSLLIAHGASRTEEGVNPFSKCAGGETTPSKPDGYDKVLDLVAKASMASQAITGTLT